MIARTAAFLLLAFAFAGEGRAELRVELVTIDAGHEVWTRFGHVGLRVVDEAVGRDELFSYGYAPFDRPEFLWGYLRGESEFYLASQPWDVSLGRYVRQDRTVRIRQINLAPAQLADLAARLDVEALPENRGYRYEHLTDNCATRVRDLLDAVSGGALGRAAGPRFPGATYRDYTLDAGSGRTVVQVVFDLIGGPSQERPLDGWAQMYLPIYLEEVAAEAAVELPDGTAQPLVGHAQTLHRRGAAPATTGNRELGRAWVLGLGLGLGFALAVLGRSSRRVAGSRGRARLHGLLLLPAALVFGLVGLALLALVFVSRVPDFAWNENVLLFWPTDLVGAWLGLKSLVTGRPAGRKLWRSYLIVRVVVLGLYAGAKVTGLLPQDNWMFLAAAVAVIGGELAGAWIPAADLVAHPVASRTGRSPAAIRSQH